MNDSFGGGQFDSTQTPGAKAEKKSEGVISLFVKQIQKSDEEGVKMWGKTYGFVSIVGIIRNIDFLSTKITYLCEDHTGRIEAHLWIDDGESINAPKIALNNYARIFGSVRQQGDTRVMMIYKILPVESPKELVTHLLEVLYCRYKTESIFKKSEEATEAVPNFGLNTSKNPAQLSNYGLSGKNLIIYQAIKAFDQPDGISRQALRQKFPHISPQELQNILECLFQEGHVFTSVDPDHYLPTE